MVPTQVNAAKSAENIIFLVLSVLLIGNDVSLMMESSRVLAIKIKKYFT